MIIGKITFHNQIPCKCDNYSSLKFQVNIGMPVTGANKMEGTKETNLGKNLEM